MTNEIYLFNTYTRKKELFVPLEPQKVKIYTCGPTVYDYPHIGNLRAYIFSDILRRMFEFNKYTVNQVINITDVGHLTSDDDEGDDKIEIAAKKQGRSSWEISKFFTDVFKQNLIALNIEMPVILCKATDHIAEQIALIRCLEKLGYTYLTSDGIYFDTSKVADYGHLSRVDIGGLKPGARVEFNKAKRNPTDFALWKFSPKDQKRQMEWFSPWGKGFPGWHIECSAMAIKYLGETMDIHTGGIDHIPVHHTNEIAQSEAATGKQFARYWMHVAFLRIDGNKMAKSQGNFVTLQDIADNGYDPLAFRYLLLTAKYSARLNFTWESLAAAQTALLSLRQRIAEIGNTIASDADKGFINEFRGYINDDLNTPKAIAFLWKLISLSMVKKRTTFAEFDRVLGLNLVENKKINLSAELTNLIERREVLRKEKKWDKADQIRIKLESMGYKVNDTRKGPHIKR